MQGLINPLTNQPITDADLKSVSDLIQAQSELEKQIESTTKTLGELSDRFRKVSEQLIPDAMAALGLDELKMSDGTKVKVDTYYAASIPADSQSAAFAWLRSSNNDSIIKRDVVCKFGKGEDDKAAQLTKKLAELGFTYMDKSYVHPMTLKSFVRENIESGKSFPSELFGVFVGKRTKLTPPKK